MDLQNLKTNDINPRKISTEQFNKLKKSIASFSKMLEIRPIAYDDDGVVWGGNQRFNALCELSKDGFEVKDSYFKKLDGFTEEEKKEFAIRDNIELGEWDYDTILGKWVSSPLENWGLDDQDWKIFVPNYEPTFSNKVVTEDDIGKSLGELSNKFKNDITKEEVVCPECGRSFFVHL